jgi:hypothetical protein
MACREGKRLLGFVGFVRDWHKLDRILKYVAEKDDESLCLLLVGSAQYYKIAAGGIKSRHI